MENVNNNYPQTFKLSKAGDSAIVRFCHSTPETIEKQTCHWLQKGETLKHVKCLGENCPACAAKIKRDERAYIRLYDYSDNTYKVWDRTNNKKFFDSVKELFNTWETLCDIVVKITRDSDEFPTYTLMPIPSKNYPTPADFDKEKDQKIAYRLVANRSAEDVQKFLDTGVMPPKPQKSQENNEKSQGSNYTADTANVQHAQNTAVVGDIPTISIEDEDLPF